MSISNDVHNTYDPFDAQKVDFQNEILIYLIIMYVALVSLFFVTLFSKKCS